MNRIVKLYVDNWKIILLTFEIFWIVVFVLDAAVRTTGGDVTQFVYVNF